MPGVIAPGVIAPGVVEVEVVGVFTFLKFLSDAILDWGGGCEGGGGLMGGVLFLVGLGSPAARAPL